MKFSLIQHMVAINAVVDEDQDGFTWNNAVETQMMMVMYRTLCGCRWLMFV